MSKYVLIEDTKERPEPLYFKQMTGIGPMTTSNKDEAEIFKTHDAAMECPAHRHTLTFWKVVEL